MNDYSEDPFQMDEDLKTDQLAVDPNTAVKHVTTSGSKLKLNDSTNATTATCKNNISASLLSDITPPYDANDTDFDVRRSIMAQDNDVIRSKIAQLKLQETTAANNNTTEEDEVYEEDLDDKLDLELQRKIERDYDEQLQKQHQLQQDSEHQETDAIGNGGAGASSDFAFAGMELTPPENFAPVINTIYRSSFPQPVNFSFLKKLKLKSILCLIPEDYPDLHLKFLEQQNIKLFQLGMSGNKEPFVKISSELITEAIKIVINPENQPILIHCNRGKHRTGCLVGVLRRLQKWSLTIIFDEYRKFAAPKERPMDQQFIELYDEKEIVKFAQANDFLPLKWD